MSSPVTITAPTKTLIPKAQRHEYDVVSHPPSSGPTAAIPPMVEPHTANAMARSRPTNVAFSVDRVEGSSIAAPRPWTTRAEIRSGPF